MKRIKMGNLGGGVYGLKVSKPGFNVETAAAENLLFDSTSPGMYRRRGTYTFAFVSGGSSQQIITHNIGGTPLLLWSIKTGPAGTSNEPLTIYTTPTQLVVGRPGTSGGGISVTVHLFTEVAV